MMMLTRTPDPAWLELDVPLLPEEAQANNSSKAATNLKSAESSPSLATKTGRA
jgi:hypothetical protein